ncbi:vesicle-trafficking protein SEC22a-like [Liolophura sinensis]|uniref:vesicle-trafficking protein SEC22a-like n=1 Tax=Liolophura sinensis TaxID=3198878 RepID=UPI0031584B38
MVGNRSVNMVLYALVSRTQDGLPLVASTHGFQDGVKEQIQEPQKFLKLLSRKATKYPDRCALAVGEHYIYFITALGLGFFVICDQKYPRVLAFSFLDEVEKEFLRCFDRPAVESVARPYALIEFDVFLHKTKNRYNNPRSLTTKINLSDMSQELKLRPPFEISAEDLFDGGGYGNSQAKTYRTAAFYGTKYQSLGLLGYLSICLDLFCSALNLTRGVAVINEGHVDDFGSDLFQYGLTFILLCFLSLFQVYLQVIYVKTRRALACGTLGSICLCQLYLWEQRNNYQIVFHVTVACVSTFVIFTRNIQQKLPEYSL